MWTPWSAVTAWGRASNSTAVENARGAAIGCSRARLERVEIELYVEELAARRERPPVTAWSRGVRRHG
jgi:hypothetical protein